MAVTSDNDIFWYQLENTDFVFLSIYIIVAVIPFIVSYKQKTSIALAMVLSLLLVMFVRYTLTLVDVGFYEIQLLAMIPILSDDPQQIYRFVTAAWLHADWIHVLSNILVIGLVGVPLEQRLGSKRWIIVYFLGFIGGNIAWVMTHPESFNPAIGASGAAFGLLGAYMACWPNDEIEFPLLFLIRAWPIWIIVFVRLGLEIYQIYSIQEGTSGETNIAHMAHVGGFILAYLFARIIARGAPSSLTTDSSNPSEGSHNESMRKIAKKNIDKYFLLKVYKKNQKYLLIKNTKFNFLKNLTIFPMEELSKPKNFNENLNFKMSNMNMNIKIQYLKNSDKFQSPYWINKKKLDNYMLPSFTKKIVKYLERN